MAWTEKYVTQAAAGGGDGSSGSPWTLAEAITNAAAGHRINVQSDGVYTGAASLTFANAAASTSAIWWRGYDTTIGDLDNVSTSTNFPFLDMSGGDYEVLISGASNWFSCFKITGATITGNTASVRITGAGCRVFNCEINGTGADADARAVVVSGTGDGSSLFGNLLTSPTTAASVVLVQGNSKCHIANNVITGGTIGIQTNASSPLSIYGNLIYGPDAAGLQHEGTDLVAVIGNTFYDIGTSAVKFTTASGAIGLVANNAMSVCGAYGIDASGATQSQIVILNNLTHSCTSGVLNGIYESVASGNVADSSSPFVNAASNDFRLTSGSNGIGNGSPQQLFGLGAGGVGSPDIGALHSAGGSSNPLIQKRLRQIGGSE